MSMTYWPNEMFSKELLTLLCSWGVKYAGMFRHHWFFSNVFVGQTWCHSEKCFSSPELCNSIQLLQLLYRHWLCCCLKSVRLELRMTSRCHFYKNSSEWLRLNVTWKANVHALISIVNVWSRCCLTINCCWLFFEKSLALRLRCKSSVMD